MKRDTWTGSRCRVSRETTTMVVNASGTAQAAGWDLGLDWDRIIRFGAAADDDVLVGAGRYAAFLAPESEARRMAGE